MPLSFLPDQMDLKLPFFQNWSAPFHEILYRIANEVPMPTKVFSETSSPLAFLLNRYTESIFVWLYIQVVKKQSVQLLFMTGANYCISFLSAVLVD